MLEPEEKPVGHDDDALLPDAREDLAENVIEPQPMLSGVRRRRRRRVSKKKTVKDVEGYLGSFKLSWLVFSFPGGALTPFFSDERRTGLGIILRGRAKGVPAASIFFGGAREKKYQQAWAREYHVLLLKEVMG